MMAMMLPFLPLVALLMTTVSIHPATKLLRQYRYNCPCSWDKESTPWHGITVPGYGNHSDDPCIAALTNHHPIQKVRQSVYSLRNDYRCNPFKKVANSCVILVPSAII